MPEVNCQWYVNDMPAIIPSVLRQECDRMQLDVSFWWGKANSFQNANGATPCKACVLLERQQVDLLSSGSGLTLVNLRIVEDTTNVVIPDLVFLRARCVTPGAPANDPSQAYVVELSDKRWLARMSVVETAFNVLPASGIPGGAILADWSAYVQEIWDAVGQLGAFPGLPLSFAHPPVHRILPNVNALAALQATLELLGCTLVYDERTATYSIGVVGAPGDTNSLNALLAIWDQARPPAIRSETIAPSHLPATIRVVFPSRDWTYSTLSSIYPSTQDEWQLKSTYHVDMPSSGSTGTVTVYDDLPAIFAPSGALVNAVQLDTRAEERAAAFERMASIKYEQRVYAGLCGGDFATSGALSALAYYDRGNGFKTEIITRPLRSITTPSQSFRWDHEHDWNGTLAIPTEHIATPDVGRWHIPYHRLAWVKLLGDIKDRQCGLARVLEMNVGGATAFSTSCPSGGAWRETGSILNNVVDLTGGSHKAGDIVCVWYHQQSDLWTILAGGGGEGSGWWAELKDRLGESYSHREIVWIDDRCDSFIVLQNGRSGDFNAYDVNCGAHNSQGPIHPLHVWMRGPYYDSEGNDFYLFDYSATNEEDSERFLFTP